MSRFVFNPPGAPATMAGRCEWVEFLLHPGVDEDGEPLGPLITPMTAMKLLQTDPPEVPTEPRDPAK